MTLAGQVAAQAQLLAGQLDEKQTELLKVLCQGAVCGIQSRLRPGLTVDDCKADFLAAASLLALSSLACAEGDPERFSVGDFSVQPKSGDAASQCLRNQAEFIMAPYLRSSFSFRGV